MPTADSMTTLDGHRLLKHFDKLVDSGIVQYDGDQHTIEHIERDLKFQFLVTSALSKKPAFGDPSASKSAQTFRSGSDISTEGFEIEHGVIGSQHVLAANKFCYARPHLMLLTADGHRRQDEPLDEHDLTAAWNLIHSLDEDYIVFFNCGEPSGCSRLHKHMQAVPKPIKSFASFLDSHGGAEEPAVPFKWFFRQFTPHITPSPLELLKTYTELLRSASLAASNFTRLKTASESPTGDAVCPHNFLFTKEWMLVIPRRKAGINENAGVNALGMLGVMPVASQKEIGFWTSLELSKSLSEPGIPCN